MKSRFFLLPFFASLFIFCSGCKERETLFTNSSTNITTQIKIETERVRSNAMSMGETWANTKELDLKDELRERYGIDLETNELISFKINRILVTWLAKDCDEISYLQTKIVMPEIDDIEFEAGGDDWYFYCTSVGQAISFLQIKLIDINSGNDPHGITEVDFAEAISRGENILTDYTITAAKEIEAESMSMSFSIFSVAEFRPK